MHILLIGRPAGWGGSEALAAFIWCARLMWAFQKGKAYGHLGLAHSVGTQSGEIGNCECGWALSQAKWTNFNPIVM